MLEPAPLRAVVCGAMRITLPVVVTAALLCSAQPVGGPSLHVDVQGLLSRSERDGAYARLIEAGEWRGAGDYVEQRAESVRHVVLCPQFDGAPLFAVFFGEGAQHRAEGRYVFVAADGALVRVQGGAKQLFGVLEDANGDGVLDVIDSQIRVEGDGALEVVSVVPCTEEQRPSLRVALNRRESLRGTPSDPWGWQLMPSEDAGVIIELGPLDADGWVSSVLASYEWDAQNEQWSGPAGSASGPFERLGE